MAFKATQSLPSPIMIGSGIPELNATKICLILFYHLLYSDHWRQINTFIQDPFPYLRQSLRSPPFLELIIQSL